jgi:hypothetical protein
MEKKFSASFKKKGKDLYNIALEAILNLDLKLVSEDDKNLTIDAKTRMNWENFGLNLNLSINGSKIKLNSSTFQVTDWGESEKISKKIFNEIKKLSLSKKKKKPVKKEKIEQSIQKTKESSQSNLIWWISGVVGFVILLMVIGSGGNNSGTNANSQTYSFSSKRVVCTGNGCVIKCSYSGSSLDYWTKFYDDGYHVRLPRWGCPLRLDKNGYPAN